jgi:hypothetical protein
VSASGKHGCGWDVRTRLSTGGVQFLVSAAAGGDICLETRWYGLYRCCSPLIPGKIGLGSRSSAGDDDKEGDGDPEELDEEVVGGGVN